MTTRRRALLVLLVGLPALAVGLGALVLVPRRHAVRTLLAFLDEAPADLAAYTPVPDGYRLLADPDQFGVRRAWVCAPRGPGPHPVLVFLHGVAPEGIRDGRVRRAVEAFRRGGFLVVAPEVAALVDPTQRDEDEARLRRLLEAIAAGAVEGAKPRRIGVVAISVGGAVALRVCAGYRAAGGSGVAAILAIGAPADIRRPARAWFALPDPDPAGGGSFAWKRRNAAAFARNFLARAALARRLGSHPDGAVLRAWLAGSEIPQAMPDNLSSPSGRALARALLAPPAQRAPLWAPLLEDAWDQFEPLSPADWASDLAHLAGVGVFLLHGIEDPLVPVEEAARLRALLEPHTAVSVLRSRMVGHTQVGAVDVAEQIAHVVFMDDFFGMVR